MGPRRSTAGYSSVGARSAAETRRASSDGLLVLGLGDDPLEVADRLAREDGRLPAQQRRPRAGQVDRVAVGIDVERGVDPPRGLPHLERELRRLEQRLLPGRRPAQDEEHGAAVEVDVRLLEGPHRLLPRQVDVGELRQLLVGAEEPPEEPARASRGCRTAGRGAAARSRGASDSGASGTRR